MIEVDVLFKQKDGTKKNETKTFTTKTSALRYMYGIERKKHVVLGWKCEDPNDNEYLHKRFKTHYERLL